MKIDKLIFENSAQFTPWRGADVSIRIETEDINWYKSKIKQINLINSWFFWWTIYLLNEIRTFFSEEIENEELIDITEVKYSFLDPQWKINNIVDIDKSVYYERSFSDKIKKLIHIGSFSINSTRHLDSIILKEVWYCADLIKITYFDDCESIRIDGGMELKIDWTWHKCKNITLNSLLDNSIIWLENLRWCSVELINLSSPIGPLLIQKLDIAYSEIEFIQLMGFDNEGFTVNKFTSLFNFIKKGFIKNIFFSNFQLWNTELESITFSDIIFPKNPEKFILKDSSFSGCRYSNIDWWNYFAEKETVIYKKDWKENKKEHKISNNGLKETYRMFKYEHDEIWNKTEANKFFAKEMEYHMKELKESWNLKDYWIAKLQKEVSDFGNDWVRAFSWYIIFTLLCYAIYSWFNFFSHEWVNSWNSQRFLSELSLLTRALNPLPKVEDIINPLLLLFSIIKILVVYQIVVALRRISQR